MSCRARIRPRYGLFAIAHLLALCLSACAVGPKYARPTVEVPAKFKEAPEAPAAPGAPEGGWIPAQPGDAASRGAWWEVFGDGELDALEQKVDASNQRLQVALATLRQARAGLEASRALGLPTIEVGAAASQSLTSRNLRYRAQAGHTLPDYLAAATSSWEPDLWGRIGHAVESSTADAQASQADLESLRLSLHAELAFDYFNLRGLDAQNDLLGRTVVAYRDAVQLTQNRFDGGLASQSDVAQAQTQLAASEAQQIDLGVLRAQYEHAIATLTGQPASTFSLPPRAMVWPVPAIPSGLPSQLLQRRPDISVAERRVAAANARIGIARSAFFPSLTLAGSVGLESSNFNKFLTGPSLFWALGPQLAQTVFDGGLRRANVVQAWAQYDADVAAYRGVVLAAFQEVEDDLAALRILQQEAAKQDRATHS
ncbi:MAG: efflux transporter outer membrane subunit, partial [Hyphomicrobiales bacterium]|nr:efflux transporter outer membrane subunit [Hyphomicrobiales bacterium]